MLQFLRSWEILGLSLMYDDSMLMIYDDFMLIYRCHELEELIALMDAQRRRQDQSARFAKMVVSLCFGEIMLILC